MDANGNITLTFKNGRDVDNNSITNDPNLYKNGAFRFSKGGESGINNFLAAADRAGIKIYNDSASSVGSGSSTLSCTGSEATNDLICTVEKSK